MHDGQLRVERSDALQDFSDDLRMWPILGPCDEQNQTVGHDSKTIAESRENRKGFPHEYTGHMKNERVGVFPDLHAPFHDVRAFDTALEAMYQAKVNRVVILGDWIDCYTVSRHPKDPARKERFEDELRVANECADMVCQLDVPTHFCAGNHEDFFRRYIQDRAPEIYGVAPTMRQLLKIDDRGWDWTPHKRSLQLGKVFYTHDVGRSGVNAARQAVADFGASIITGHTHGLHASYDGTVYGDRRVGITAGWLGDVNSIDYRHREMCRRQWQHGFVLVDYDDDGCGWCNTIPILDGRAMVDGRIVRG